MKTSTEYSRERRKRLKDQGYKRLENVWIKPENEATIKALIKHIESGGTINDS